MGIFNFFRKKFGVTLETEPEEIKNTEPEEIKDTEPELLAPKNENTLPDSVEDLAEPELPAPETENAFPHSVEDLKEWHIRALRNLNKHPENVPFFSLEVDMPKFIRFAFIHELIAYVPYDDVLYMLKNESLKSILRENGLRVSGNKNELVHRIRQSIDINTVMNSDYYTNFYILTPKGKALIHQSSARIAEEEYHFFTDSMSLILDYRFNEAYRMLCKKYAEMPISPGLNCDWEKRYYDGLSFEQIQSLCEELDNSKNRIVTAAAIFHYMSTDTIRTIVEYLKLMDNTLPEDVKEALQYQICLMNTKRNFKSYVKCGIEEYRFWGCLDTITCPICAKLDGKIFKTSEAKIGVNCPPMHPLCRCTTIAIFSKIENNNSTRAARDANGKSIKIPMSMTYDEWYEKYGSQ